MGKVDVSPSRMMMTTPVVLLSCRGADNKPNIITLAWSGVLCSDPPTVYGSIRPSRHSYKILKENGDFVINLPTAEQVREVDICGTVSGRDEDKFALCGFTAVESERVNAPLIAECPVNIECRTRQVLELGIHHAFIAEVIAVLANEEIMAGKKASPDFAPVVYSAGSRNYHHTELIKDAFYGFSQKG